MGVLSYEHRFDEKEHLVFEKVLVSLSVRGSIVYSIHYISLALKLMMPFPGEVD